MLKTFRATRSNVLVWFLMGLLIIGLAGFGIGVSGGLTAGDVARVGDQRIGANDFGRAVNQELSTISGQIGRGISMAEARQFGLDRAVLSRLVNEAALDGEAARIGLSMGDDVVRAQVLATPAFQSLGGTFDRQAYVFALQRLGLTPSTFEDMLRREAARGLVAAGVQSATAMPDTMALTLLAYAGETRAIDWIRLDAAQLPEPVATPTDAELAAWHADNPGRYTRPETRVIAYAAVRPEALAAGIEIPEDELRAIYDADTVRYHTPERRIVDRIGFSSDADASAARARLDAGELDFDELAAERGLSGAEIAQGPVDATALPEGAREAVFGHDGPGIVGPVPTPLGPSLFRINGVLAAQTVPFAAASATIARDRALEEARQSIAEEMAAIDDLIAGGASLEEIASETIMELGSVELNSETEGGIADDPAFRTLADGARQGEETDLAELADGGLVVVRLEAVEPPRVIPLAEIRDRVAADWTEARTAEALTAVAEGFRDEIAGGLAFADLAGRLGREVQSAPQVARGASVPGVPPALVGETFEADEGAVLIHADGDGVILARLAGITAFDPAAPESAAILQSLRTQFRGQAAGDVLALFTAALRNRDGVYVNEDLIETTLALYQ